MNIMRKQINQLFVNPQRTMFNGLWFSGYENEGEYKEWGWHWTIMEALFLQRWQVRW